MTRRLVLLLVLAVLVAGCDREAPEPTPPVVTVGSVGSVGYPRPGVTPGGVLTTRTTDVCTPGWASKHRRGLSAKQKTTVLKAYGYPTSQKVAEWDHLVSLELGGGNGVRNIWPQVDHAQDQRKDRLENTLHQQVCAGQLTLTQAQVEIRQFWLYW
jgi:hypothetical protein